jgi:hypothetical protein
MIIKLLIFWWFFSKFQIQFWIRIHNLESRIRIRQKVSDPYRSVSTTRVISDPELWDFIMNADLDPLIRPKK